MEKAGTPIYVKMCQEKVSSLDFPQTRYPPKAFPIPRYHYYRGASRSGANLQDRGRDPVTENFGGRIVPHGFTSELDIRELNRGCYNPCRRRSFFKCRPLRSAC